MTARTESPSILLTHPFSWPYVRRGSERFLHELATYLASRNYDVTVLSSTPHTTEEVSTEEGFRMIRKPQAGGALKLIGVAPEKSFPIRCFPFMMENRFDITHCLYFYDGCAAAFAEMFNRRRFILHITGIPIKRFYRRRPWDYMALKLALARAAEVIVPSRMVFEQLQSDFGYSGRLLPVPCDLRQFPLSRSRDLDRPRILCVGAFAERRKGARVLLQAFHLVKQAVPTAILQYSGDMPSTLRNELAASSDPGVLKDVEFLGRGMREDLPRLYGSAAVTAIPSIQESFGMVLIESLACGTPIVAARNGALPEIFSPGIGEMFDPGSAVEEAANAQGLSQAILNTLRMHGDPALADRCRRRAEDFSWQALGPDYEKLYRRFVG